MGREYSLLERLARGAGRGRSRHEQSAAEDVDALMESVRNNLARLLNARQGMAEAQPDYGLPSLVDLTTGSGSHMHMLQEAVRLTIEKYEPRLRRVRVAPHTEGSTKQTLVFRIEAVLVGRSGEHRVWYETSLRAGGQFEVSG